MKRLIGLGGMGLLMAAVAMVGGDKFLAGARGDSKRVNRSGYLPHQGKKEIARHDRRLKCGITL